MHNYFFKTVDIFDDSFISDAFKELDILWNDCHIQFPPTNRLVEKETGNLVLQMAVAGYSPEDISVTTEDNFILVEGKSQNKDESKYVVQAKGIKGSSFKAKYPLSTKFDMAKIEASFKNGILEIVVPVSEEKKPKSVKINF